MDGVFSRPKRGQVILEQHRGLFIWGASLAGCPPETDFPWPSLRLQRLRQGESGQKEVENSLFTFHWETWTRNQCFRPSLSRFPRQDSLTPQSALRRAAAETVKAAAKAFMWLSLREKHHLPLGAFRTQVHWEIWFFFQAGPGDYFSRESTCIIAGEIYMFNFLWSFLP